VAFFQLGIQGYSGGVIADQTLLLQDIRDGLIVYNQGQDPIIDRMSEVSIRQTIRMSQAPKKFWNSADGGNPYDARMVYRLLQTPLRDYDLSSEFTVKWLQDALLSDVVNEVNGAMTGDAQLMNALFFNACLQPQTVGAIGTPYVAGFYNGETDVPPYKNNSFGSAHYHYQGANSTTLTYAVFRAMKQTIQEHGYGLNAGQLELYFSTTQIPDVMALVNSNTTILQGETPMRQAAIDRGVYLQDIMLEGVILKVSDDVPAGYCVMLANDVKPLTKRVHVTPAYQGLQMYAESLNENFPLAGQKFLRRVGFSVQYLGAGCAYQLVGSTTYTAPTLTQIPTN